MIKFTSCLHRVGGSLQVLRLPPLLNWSPWYSWKTAESGIKTQKSSNLIKWWRKLTEGNKYVSNFLIRNQDRDSLPYTIFNSFFSDDGMKNKQLRSDRDILIYLTLSIISREIKDLNPYIQNRVCDTRCTLVWTTFVMWSDWNAGPWITWSKNQ